MHDGKQTRISFETIIDGEKVRAKRCRKSKELVKKWKKGE